MDGVGEVESGANHVEVGECFGFRWVNGHHWGVAHPDANCYAEAGCTRIDGGGSRMVLDVGFGREEYHGREYPWAVGLVRSAETVGYGTLEVEFMLPLGCNLQPAVWLYDARHWPPEIDVVEGWSLSPRWWMPRGSRYRRSLLTDKVHPSAISPGSAGVGDGEVEAVRGGHPRSRLWHGWLDVAGVNRAVMLWTPGMLDVSYNGCRVMHLTATAHPDLFRWLNGSGGMNIFLNNYTTDAFTYDDYMGLGRPFIIRGLRYTPL